MTSFRSLQSSLSGLIFSTIAVAALLGACTGSQSGAEAPEGGSADADASPHFDDMSHGKKLNYMKTVVAPKMAKVWEESPEQEDDFSCETCHGPGAQNGDFEMPTDGIPILNDEEIAEHPEMTKFMKERVTPVMAELLGEDDFGCGDCHLFEH